MLYLQVLELRKSLFGRKVNPRFRDKICRGFLSPTPETWLAWRWVIEATEEVRAGYGITAHLPRLSPSAFARTRTHYP
ncbi:hypothetical protein KCP73_12410 [Salmonella enterica subsp. enterica]|nr:hypothetical protein KCP73_12410 [Salmonella enterica subsp. enterica]